MLSYIWLGIAALLVAVDQLVKFWAEHSLSQVDTIPLISGVFHLTYVQNFGAAFNTMNNQRFLLVGVTSAVLLLILVLLLTQAEEAGEEMTNEPKMQAQMMVPLREAAKENGYTVKWQGKQKPIVLEKDGTSIEITLGSAEYVVEGDMVMKAAMPSELKDGKTYVSSEIFN